MSDQTPQTGTEASVRDEIDAALDSAASVPPRKESPPLIQKMSAVNIERDQRVKRLRNKGLAALMPGHRFRGHRVRLRPQQHGSISVKRQEWTRDIRQALGLRKKDDMHAAGNIELNRRLVLYTIVSYEGTFVFGKDSFDLAEMSPGQIREFFQLHYLPPIDLSRPDEPETFDEFDMELLNAILETHERLDVVPWDELDRKGEGFVLGATEGIDFND